MGFRCFVIEVYTMACETIFLIESNNCSSGYIDVENNGLFTNNNCC